MRHLEVVEQIQIKRVDQLFMCVAINQAKSKQMNFFRKRIVFLPERNEF